MPVVFREFAGDLLWVRAILRLISDRASDLAIFAGNEPISPAVASRRCAGIRPTPAT
jgi:hypothetical protein